RCGSALALGRQSRPRPGARSPRWTRSASFGCFPATIPLMPLPRPALWSVSRQSPNRSSISRTNGSGKRRCCADRLISKVRYAAPGAASFAFGQRDRPVKASTRKVRSERSSADPSRGGELRHKSGPQFLALTAIGVAFGDIGTTPLYTLQAALVATHHAEPTSADVLGIVSLIFWALMAMVSLNYVVLVLRADHDADGGILALLLLVERITNGPGSPILVLLGMAGAALLYSGGAITPALSVLSAMEGLKLVNAPSGSGVEAMQRLINPVNLNFHAFVFNLLHEH